MKKQKEDAKVINIRALRAGDLPACLEIYNYYIENTTYSFEEEPLSLAAFAKRAENISAEYPFLIAEEDGKILGYAYLSAFSDRTAYRFTADLSIYLSPSSTGKGTGGILLSQIELLGRAAGIKNVISIITEENSPSLTFHEKHGYSVCGDFPAVGYKFGRWLGVKYLIKAI